VALAGLITLPVTEVLGASVSAVFTGPKLRNRVTCGARDQVLPCFSRKFGLNVSALIGRFGIQYWPIRMPTASLMSRDT